MCIKRRKGKVYTGSHSVSKSHFFRRRVEKDLRTRKEVRKEVRKERGKARVREAREKELEKLESEVDSLLVKQARSTGEMKRVAREMAKLDEEMGELEEKGDREAEVLGKKHELLAIMKQQGRSK